MIEPDLKYCPRCNDEYRAEIEMCAVCEVELITGRRRMELEEEKRKKLQSRAAELSPDDDLVALRRGPLADMRHLAMLLDNENIGTLLAGDEKTCGKSCCPSVYDLLVRRQDAVEALDIIEEEHRRTTGLEHYDREQAEAVYNPDAGEACCPACGHVFPPRETACPDCGLSFA